MDEAACKCLAENARRVIGCHSAQLTRFLNALGDVASHIRQAIPDILAIQAQVLPHPICLVHHLGLGSTHISGSDMVSIDRAGSGRRMHRESQANWYK